MQPDFPLTLTLSMNRNGRNPPLTPPRRGRGWVRGTVHDHKITRSLPKQSVIPSWSRNLCLWSALIAKDRVSSDSACRRGNA